MKCRRRGCRWKARKFARRPLLPRRLWGVSGFSGPRWGAGATAISSECNSDRGAWRWHRFRWFPRRTCSSTTDSKRGINNGPTPPRPRGGGSLFLASDDRLPRARARAFYTGKVCAERPQPRGISVSAFSVARWGGSCRALRSGQILVLRRQGLLYRRGAPQCAFRRRSTRRTVRHALLVTLKLHEDRPSTYGRMPTGSAKCCCGAVC